MFSKETKYLVQTDIRLSYSDMSGSTSGGGLRLVASSMSKVPVPSHASLVPRAQKSLFSRELVFLRGIRSQWLVKASHCSLVYHAPVGHYISCF